MKRVILHHLPDDEITIGQCRTTWIYGMISDGTKYYLFLDELSTDRWKWIQIGGPHIAGKSMSFTEVMETAICNSDTVIQFDNIQEFVRWLAE